MTGAFVIFCAMVVIGLLLYITDVKYYRHHHDKTVPSKTNNNSSDNLSTQNDSQQNQSPEICCGMHLVCEKDSLAIISDEIIYYDDEELDRFANRAPESYNHEETEEFRDILLTLLPQDIEGWGRSLTLRNIQLPPEVKEEFLMMVAELRDSRT